MANIKAETQLNFTSKNNTYNDIANKIIDNRNIETTTTEQNISNDDTKKLFIVRPVDENMLGNPFNDNMEPIKHPQIKFHQRQTYVQQQPLPPPPPSTTATRQTIIPNTNNGNNQNKRKQQKVIAMKSNNVQNNTRNKSRSPARRSRVGGRRRTKNTRGIKKHSKKKPKSKKIFHKGVWLVVPTAGNNFPITKESDVARKMKRRRRKKRTQRNNENYNDPIPPPAPLSSTNGQKLDRRPAWNNSPLLKEKDYGNNSNITKNNSPNRSSPTTRRTAGAASSSIKKGKKSPALLQHNRSLNSTQTTHVSMTEVGEDGPLRLSYDDDNNNNINNRSSYESMLSESLLSTSYISTTNNQIVQDTPQQQQRPEEEEEEEEEDDDEIYNNNNMPRLNKSISPRMNNNNKNNRINVSIDIPIDSQDNRHTLPFTPANIVSKHKGQKKRNNSSKRNKSSSIKKRNTPRTSNNSNVIDALDLHEEEDDQINTTAASATKTKNKNNKKRIIRKSLSSSTRSARSSGGYLRRSRSSPLSQSARRSVSPSNNNNYRNKNGNSKSSGSSPNANDARYEKARLEVEKLIKKQKAYLEAQAKITLNEIKQQQRNPNTFLDKSVNSITNLRNMIFPLIREAEEILVEAQNKTRKSHFIYNNTIMNILAKKSASVIGDNIDELVDMVLDSILNDTCSILNENEEIEQERKRREELPLLLAQARKEMSKLEMMEDDIVNKVNQRLLHEEDLGLNNDNNPLNSLQIDNTIDDNNHNIFTGISNDGQRNSSRRTTEFRTSSSHRSTMDISETGIRIDGNGNEFKTINRNNMMEDGNSNNKNNELFPGVTIPITRREKELIIKKNKIMKNMSKGLGYQDIVDIERNRTRFATHLETKEHSLHNTGLNQTQIIELLENDIIMNLVGDVAGEFDTILGNAAGTLMENV